MSKIKSLFKVDDPVFVFLRYEDDYGSNIKLVKWGRVKKVVPVLNDFYYFLEDSHGTFFDLMYPQMYLMTYETVRNDNNIKIVEM